MKPDSKIAAARIYAIVFGLFLGLCIWKFGNPVILDHIIAIPASMQDLLSDAWPTHWANWILLPLVAWGAVLAIQGSSLNWPSKWLWLLPAGWLLWQFISAGQTVDAHLTTSTLWQFCGCAGCYVLGALVFARHNVVRWVLIGIMAALAFCLVRAVDQRLFEYPDNYRTLVEGEQCGWTNFPVSNLAEMKSEGIVVTTNGVDVASPVILAKFAKGRVSGTLVYPNALAQIILLLWPVSLALAFGAKQLRPLVRFGAIGLTVFLGGAALFWSGSKLGWLIAIGLVALLLFRLKGAKKLRLMAVATVLVLGLAVFAIRFHHYFSAGATSAGARFDYWRAALQTTAAHPWLGTGPGTFQHPYARLKAPESEMARLAHNDFLEQFSDSGIPGGLAYMAWISLAFWVIAKSHWRTKDSFQFAMFLGLLGWFAQGLGEFGLFVPALAWTAFTLLGCLIGQNSPKEFNSTKNPRRDTFAQ